MFEEDIDDCALCGKNHVKESMQFDENLHDAYVIWGQIADIRRQIALGGKNLLVGLLVAKIGLYSHNDIALCGAMSELMGSDVDDLVFDLLKEFEGPSPSKHLWEKNASGTYRLHH